MVAAGGAVVCHTGTYDGPAWGEVYTKQMDGSSFAEPLPWELTNTDYIRRVLDQVGYSLQPVVEATVRANRAIVFQSQGPRGQIGYDAYYLIKHIRYGNHINSYANLLGCATTSQLDAALQYVFDNRNGFAHKNLDPKATHRDPMEDLFTHAKTVVQLAGDYIKKIKKGKFKANLAAKNMDDLHTQWKTHTASKARRKNALQLHVGNVPAKATKQQLVDHFNKAMHTLGYRTAPVISCDFRKNKGWSLKQKKKASIQLRSVQDTTDCLNRYLALGLKFHKCKLTIDRPGGHQPDSGAS